MKRSEYPRGYMDFNKGYTVKKEKITQNMSMCDEIRGLFEQIQPNDILSITQIKNVSKKYPAIVYKFLVKVKQKNKNCLFCHSDKGNITIQLNQLICGEIIIN